MYIIYFWIRLALHFWILIILSNSYSNWVIINSQWQWLFVNISTNCIQKMYWQIDDGVILFKPVSKLLPFSLRSYSHCQTLSINDKPVEITMLSVAETRNRCVVLTLSRIFQNLSPSALLNVIVYSSQCLFLTVSVL